MHRIPATITLLFVTLFGSVALGEGDQLNRPLTAPQKDPRGWPYTSVRFRDGKKPGKGDFGAYVIIAWANKQRGYQIWGDKRIVTQTTVTRAIEMILEERPLDLIVVGNEWAAGSELDAALSELSGRYHVDVLGGSTFGFDNVEFHSESEEVQTLVSKAITAIIKAQQDGADQPATAPESKAQGKQKQKPESEGRPQ
jgi:hypothetical protein